MPSWERQLDALVAAHQQETAPVRFDAGAHCFDAQRPFATSKAKYRTASCSRRAGKSEGEAATLIDVGQDKPGAVGLYITRTRINAKRIIWGVLKRVNRQRQLGGRAREADLCLEFPNGYCIYLVGANNRDEIEKFRGLPLAVVVIDEAQILTNLGELVDDVLAPALMDHDGSIVLGGTPGPVPVGYFFECTNNAEWEHHVWTVFDNPWILKKSGKTPQEHLDAELKRRGVTVDDPSIQREWFGRWVYDPNALVFRYSAELNDYDTLPIIQEGEWECLISGDIGWDDADALGVLEWNTTRPDIWLTEENVLPKQTITQLGDRLKEMADRKQPLTIVLDFGGLGKKIAQELTQRWGLKVEAAEKERKLEHIELLNDAMRNGRFHAKRDSRFARDCMLVEWDKTNPENPKISDRFHSDAGDMALYGYRRAKHWLFVPPEPEPPKPGTPEWHAQEAAKAQAQVDEVWEKKLEEAQTRRLERDELENDLGWL